MPMTKRIGMLVLSVAALLATASTAAAGAAADEWTEEESASAFGQDELLSEDEEEFHENGDGFDAVDGHDELTDDGGVDHEGVLSSNLEVIRCVDENTVLVKKTEFLTMPLSDLAGHGNGFAADESEEEMLGWHGENGQMSSDMEIVRCLDEDTLLVRTTGLVPTTVLQEQTMLETVELDELMHTESDGFLGGEEENEFDEESSLFGIGAFDDSFIEVDSLDDPFLDFGDDEESAFGFEDDGGVFGNEDEHERESEDDWHAFGSEEDTRIISLG